MTEERLSNEELSEELCWSIPVRKEQDWDMNEIVEDHISNEELRRELCWSIFVSKEKEWERYEMIEYQI